jgi:hypothetical protein
VAASVSLSASLPGSESLVVGSLVVGFGCCSSRHSALQPSKDSLLPSSQDSSPSS